MPHPVTAPDPVQPLLQQAAATIDPARVGGLVFTRAEPTQRGKREVTHVQRGGTTKEQRAREVLAKAALERDLRTRCSEAGPYTPGEHAYHAKQFSWFISRCPLLDLATQTIAYNAHYGSHANLEDTGRWLLTYNASQTRARRLALSAASDVLGPRLPPIELPPLTMPLHRLDAATRLELEFVATRKILKDSYQTASVLGRAHGTKIEPAKAERWAHDEQRRSRDVRLQLLDFFRRYPAVTQVDMVREHSGIPSHRVTDSQIREAMVEAERIAIFDALAQALGTAPAFVEPPLADARHEATREPANEPANEPTHEPRHETGQLPVPIAEPTSGSSTEVSEVDQEVFNQRHTELAESPSLWPEQASSAFVDEMTWPRGFDEFNDVLDEAYV